MKNSKNFIFVKCGDKKTAEEVKATNPPEVIFYNPDGEEIHRQSVKDAASIDNAMEQALKKYANREISWNAFDDAALDSARESGKVVILAFASDSKDSEAALKALEDRQLAKLHDSVVFLKATFEKDGRTEKLWGVSSAPTLVLIDPTKEAGSKATLEKIMGKKSPLSLKASIQKALKAIEKK